LNSSAWLYWVSELIEPLRDVLERLYRRYNHRQFVPPDPLQFVYRYSKRADQEVAGFLSAVLAYGRVRQVEASLTDLFSRMGESPYAFVRDFGKRQRRRLSGFKHRFTTGRDISDLLEVLGRVLGQHASLESYFVQGYAETDENLIPALSAFCDSLLEMHAARRKGRVSQGLTYLLARPSLGSACKRLNLFLRWMVRNDEVDPGLWKSIDKAKLIVPVDVHMDRLCRMLRLHDRKTVSLATAMMITESFGKIEPADPVKYDFALSRIGIVDNCDGRYRRQCSDCELRSHCFDA
jgi:uncharacterized protein (TIGR02757 family)